MMVRVGFFSGNVVKQLPSTTNRFLTVDRQVAQVLDVAFGIGELPKMVLDPARLCAFLRRGSLFVPVLAGNNAQPSILVDVGHGGALAATQVNRVFAERN